MDTFQFWFDYIELIFGCLCDKTIHLKVLPALTMVDYLCEVTLDADVFRYLFISLFYYSCVDIHVKSVIFICLN